MANCNDYISAEDLKTGKEAILHIEHVAKSRDTAGNPALEVTDPIRGEMVTNPTLDGFFSSVGFKPADGSFEAGGTINHRWEVLLYQAEGIYYQWMGALPKVVPPGSTPATTGGISATTWVNQSDLTLRSDLINTDPLKGDALITVKNQASWGVSRTQHSKNADVINIKDAGAKCDGVTDDTAAIQSIINAANGGMIKLAFPYGSVVKILGTILVPGGVSIDLNHSIIEGNGNTTTAGTNTIFESAYWDSTDNTLKSNWSVPAASVGLVGLVPDMRIYGGRIRFAGTAIKMYQMIYGSSVKDLRITECGFPVIIKDSFYGTFEELAVMSPPASVSGSIGFQIESNIQAMGIRKCVAAGFNRGWVVTGSSAADCFDTCTAEHCIRGIDIYGGASGTIMNLELHNWYFEKNTIAIRVDPATIVQRLYVTNSYLHWSVLHVDASTALSGGIDKSCVIVDSVDYPGGINMQGRCGEKTFIIELDDAVSSSHTSSTLPANYSVTGVEVKRIETLVNASNQVIARNTRQSSVPPKTYTGSTLPITLPTNVVPFATVNVTNPASAKVTTQVKRSSYNIVHVNLVVNDGGSIVNAAGTIFGSIHVLQPASAKPFSISYDASNNLVITIAGTTITDINGIVQVV